MTQEEKALQARINKLEAENKELRSLGSDNGFYNAYFKELQTSASNTEAFDKVNERYRCFFGRYRYSSYDVYRKIKNLNIKK